jgi:hypothetical protein
MFYRTAATPGFAISTKISQNVLVRRKQEEPG